MSTPILVGSLQNIQKSWISTCTVVTLVQFSRSKVKFEKLCASIHALSISYTPLFIALLSTAYIWVESGLAWVSLVLWSSFLPLAPQSGVFYHSLSKTFLRAKQLSLKTASWRPTNTFQCPWLDWGGAFEVVIISKICTS